MSFSGMVFLMLLGLIIFGPKKLPQVGMQIGRVLAELKAFTHDFKDRIEIEIEAASAHENIASASSPQSKLPSETAPGALENETVGGEPGRGKAYHG